MHRGALQAAETGQEAIPPLDNTLATHIPVSCNVVFMSIAAVMTICTKCMLATHIPVSCSVVFMSIAAVMTICTKCMLVTSFNAGNWLAVLRFKPTLLYLLECQSVLRMFVDMKLDA